MPVKNNLFIHESDRAALEALKAIPGFSQVSKAFMKAWSEKLLRIENMATKVRLSDEQLPHYYGMLAPICDNLGIDIPELYLEMNPYPNAYTTGDTNPAITVTSSLLETLPDELVATVLAHECGHIACHHVLYLTMGRWLLSSTLNLLPLNIAAPVLTPVRAAFAYWMRCSEYSADRAAILCDGSPEKTFEVCMRLAGFDKDIAYGEANLEAFFAQAKEYRELVDENATNKLMQTMLFYDRSHPVHSVRALEAYEWAQSEDFLKAKQIFEAGETNEKPIAIPMPCSSRDFVGKAYQDVVLQLQELGFQDVVAEEVADLFRDNDRRIGKVANVTANDQKFGKDDWIDAAAKIRVAFHVMEQREEK